LFSVSIASRVEVVMKMIEIVALVLVGPLVGVEFGVAAFTNPLVAKLPDDAFRQVRSGGSRLLGAVMPFWYIGTLVVLIAAAAFSKSYLVIAATALLAAALLLTVTTLVPINNRIGRWQTNADVSRDLAGRWDRLHWLRVALLAVVWLLLVVSEARFG
jgi:hypothetical protein